MTTGISVLDKIINMEQIGIILLTEIKQIY